MMPQIIPSYKGWRVVIWPNDHAPPHVHVLGPCVLARFDLLCDLALVRYKSSEGFSLKQLKLVEAYLLKHVVTLCVAWGAIHGN